jgi:hypothetical protein
MAITPTNKGTKMTLTRAFTINCDTCNTPSKVHVLAKDVRADIKSLGWSIRKGVHTCPKCKPAKAEKPKSKTEVKDTKPKTKPVPVTKA